MASPIVEKVLSRIEGEKSLKILESNFEPTRPKLWARAKELAEQRYGVYGVKAHSWAYKWYEQKGGTFVEHHQKDADGNTIPHEEINESPYGYSERDFNMLTSVPRHPKGSKVTYRGGKKVVTSKDGKEMKARPGKDGNIRYEEVELEEAATTRIPAQNGNVYELMYSWRGKSYFCKMFFPQPGKPSKDEVQAALTKVYPSAILRNCYISSVNYGDPYIHAGAGDGFTDK